MRNVSDKSSIEGQKTQFVFNILFSRKLCRLGGKVEKYSRAGQATYDNLAHGHCMLDT